MNSIVFSDRERKEKFLRSIDFYKDNGEWRPSGRGGGWISLDENDPSDWEWDTELEFIFWAAKTARKRGYSEGRKSLQKEVLELLGATPRSTL
jgi:hypothetical protein